MEQWQSIGGPIVYVDVPNHATGFAELMGYVLGDHRVKVRPIGTNAVWYLYVDQITF